METRRLFHALSTAFAGSQNEEISLDIEMDVSENSGFPPLIIHFNKVFHSKPSILGFFLLFLETSICLHQQTLSNFFRSHFGGSNLSCESTAMFWRAFPRLAEMADLKVLKVRGFSGGTEKV